MTARNIEFVIETDGHTRHLVDSASESIGAVVGPKVETWRNSHVETWSSLTQEARDWVNKRRPWERYMLTIEDFDPNWFWADMMPIDGPVLGPFKDHAHAIQAEVDWLSERDLPVPTCQDSSK